MNRRMRHRLADFLRRRADQLDPPSRPGFLFTHESHAAASPTLRFYGPHPRR